MFKNRLNILSILVAIEKIEKYSYDFENPDDFYHDEKSFDAAMMQFVVIGEIVDKIDDDFKKTYTQVEWQKIKNFRNIIAHNYFGIDADEIWDIINTKLKPLKTELEKLLSIDRGDQK